MPTGRAFTSIFLVTLWLLLQVHVAPSAHFPDDYPTATGSSGKGDNLLINPSFEEGADGPHGWKHRAVCGSTVYTWDSMHSRDGTRSVGIQNASATCNPENYWYSVEYTDVDLDNVSYLFSAYYKYLGSPDHYPQGAIGLFAYDAGKSALHTWMHEFHPSGDDWTYIEVMVDDATFHQMQVKFIRVGLFATAQRDHLDTEIRFDDIFFGTAENQSENIPPDAPIISGPTSGKTGTEYTYTFTTVDPDGDPVSLWIQWGEGCPTEEWVGPFDSGETISYARTWETHGTYTITAKARDIHGAEGDTAALTISMPLEHQTLPEKIGQYILHIFRGDASDSPLLSRHSPIRFPAR